MAKTKKTKTETKTTGKSIIELTGGKTEFLKLKKIKLIKLTKNKNK
jgi:hypothetical protein